MDNKKKAHFGKYCITDKEILKYNDGEKKYTKVSDLVKVKEIKRDIESKKNSIILQYNYKGSIHEIEVSRGSLSRQELQKLLEYGLDVFEHKASEISKFLSIQEQSAPLEYYHTHLGWCDIEGHLTYKHYELISRNNELTSVYSGDLDLSAAGSLDGWRDLIKNEVQGTVTLEMALVLGFSSIVVGYLAQSIEMESMVFHLWGDSTKGKTTAAKLAASPFGKPSQSIGGLINTWNGTKNAIINQLTNNRGIPFVLDEASMGSFKDFTNQIYQLASGIDKARMNKEAKMRKRETWATTIISTAEKSLLANATQSTGQHIRLLEFDNITWTRDARNADAIREGVEKHYGHSAPIFAQYLLDIDFETVIDLWNSWKQVLMEKLPQKDNFAERIVKKLALILLTAELVEKSLKINLNKEGLSQLLIEQNQQSLENRDIGSKALEVIIEAIYQHRRKFDRVYNETDFPSQGNENWGQIKQFEEKTEVSILPKKLRDLLMENDFEDINVVINAWKEKGILNHDAGGNQTKATVNSKRVRVYSLSLSKSVFSLKDESSMKPSKKLKSNKKTTLEDLFNNEA
ncbi:hypothetical protein DH09_10115 [Bacillaceae bacterium JMAK1]|nr:hypothetical protein DH09_10115 [Bacillaceae bacterium JMAK1]